MNRFLYMVLNEINMKNKNITNLLVVIAILLIFIAGCAQQMEKTPAEEFQEVIDTGILVVGSAPSEAQVYVDGELKGQTPLTLYNFPAGAHIIVVKKEGYMDFEKEINVKVGLTEEVDAELVPLIREVKGDIEVTKPEEVQKEQSTAQSNKINLSSFAMYYDFENKLFTKLRSEKSDIFSRKYDKYIHFTSMTSAKIKIINAPLKDVSRADCINAGATGQLYSGQTLCVITMEGNYFAVSGSWEKLPTELEFVQLN